MKNIYIQINDLQKKINANRPLSVNLFKQIKEYYRKYIQALEKADFDNEEFLMLIANMVKETQQDYIRLFI